MKLTVKKIQILTGLPGTDQITYEIENLQEGVFPFKDNAHLKQDIAKGNALQYVKTNFKNSEVECTHTDATTGKRININLKDNSND